MKWLVELLFPGKCVVCGRRGEMLCGECGERMLEAVEKCPECCRASEGGWTHQGCKRDEGMRRLIALYSYRDKEVRKVIKEIKYRFRVDLIKKLIGERECEKDVLLVPIPLFWKRKNWRGFNQAEVIAKALGKENCGRVVEALVRNKETRSLTRLRVEERKKEMGGVFEIKKGGESIKGKRVWLVDDVFTSGTTMREATKVLKKAGAKEVWGWALAS